MARKKVAPSTQWQNGGKGAGPTTLNLVDSGAGYWTLTTGTPDAHFTDSGSGYLIVGTAAASGKTIKRVGAAAVRLL